MNVEEFAKTVAEGINTLVKDGEAQAAYDVLVDTVGFLIAGSANSISALVTTHDLLDAYVYKYMEVFADARKAQE